MSIARSSALIICAFFLGCGDDPAGSAAPLEAESERLVQVMESAVADATRPDFSRVTPELAESTAVAGAMIDVWVSTPAAPAYRDLIADAAALPVGTTIIRDIYDADGQLQKHTLLHRSARENDLGGWVFGVVGADGRVVVADDGAAQVGDLPSCAGCHASQRDQGYLFGLQR